jgi:hypothetical protein
VSRDALSRSLGLFGGSDGLVLDLSLLGVLGELGLVLGDGLLLGLGSSLLEGSEVTLSLETKGGDQSEKVSVTATGA